MKQVLQRARTGEITVEEVPPPQLLPGCVLVRVAASLVSAGTERASSEFAAKNLLQKAKSRPDLVREVMAKVQRDGLLPTIKTVRSRLDQASTPGYSSAGIVIAVADDVRDIRVGDAVACAGAGHAVHAECANVPRLLVARIPELSISLEHAAFSTVGAICLHGIRTAEVKLGDTVAVIGLGLLGQLTVQMLRATGASVLGLDIQPERAQLAAQLGAHAACSSSVEFRDLCLQRTLGRGVDSVLITAETPSSDPVNLAGEIARERAIVVAVGTVGMDIERKAYYEKELDFRISRSYGPGRYDTAYEQKGRDYPIGYVRWTETRNMEAFLQLLAEKKLNLTPLITHRYPIDQAEQAYRVITGELRDSFLGVIIAYPGSDSASSDLPPSKVSIHSAPMDSRAISLGVIGAGTFAQGILLPLLKKMPSVAFDSVCTATGAHSRNVADKFGFRSCTADESEIIRNKDIDAVVIATRHNLHAASVLAAIQAGKHVFCEKPLCLTEDELREIATAYAAADPRLVLMVGFNRRFAPMALRMKSFFSDVREPLAMHYRINAGFLPADHWTNDPEQGGGRILGELCHFIDFLIYIAGSAPVEVHARPLRNPGQYSGDNLVVSLSFADGSECTISYLANGDRSYSKERVEIFGGGSVAALEDFRELELVRHGRRNKTKSRWSQDKGHQAELQAFVDAIRGKRTSPVGIREIVATTLATLRVQQSIATGENVRIDVAAWLDDRGNTHEPTH
jgi:predicted dehydrogenase/threonine dehydrogenase-like Zn-dependent dehydrogenase